MPPNCVRVIHYLEMYWYLLSSQYRVTRGVNASWTGVAASHSNNRHRWLQYTFVAGDGYRHQWTGSSFNQIMACRWTTPSHYLNQCWIIVNWTFWNNIQSNFNRNSWAQTRTWRGFLNALIENRHFFLQNMQNLRPFHSTIVRYFPQNLHICNFAVIHYQLLWPNCCKTSTFGYIKAITCVNACRGHYGTSAWPRSMHESSTHCDYSSMKRWSPAVRGSRIYSNQALTPSWRRLTTENWNIFIQKMDLKM